MVEKRKLSVFEKYLTLWVLLCIGAGIFLGKIAPEVTVKLNSLSIYNVSIPIAIYLFFMMYPIIVRIDFAEGDMIRPRPPTGGCWPRRR